MRRFVFVFAALLAVLSSSVSWAGPGPPFPRQHEELPQYSSPVTGTVRTVPGYGKARFVRARFIVGGGFYKTDLQQLTPDIVTELEKLADLDSLHFGLVIGACDPTKMYGTKTDLESQIDNAGLASLRANLVLGWFARFQSSAHASFSLKTEQPVVLFQRAGTADLRGVIVEVWEKIPPPPPPDQPPPGDTYYESYTYFLGSRLVLGVGPAYMWAGSDKDYDYCTPGGYGSLTWEQGRHGFGLGIYGGRTLYETETDDLSMNFGPFYQYAPAENWRFRVGVDVVHGQEIPPWSNDHAQNGYWGTAAKGQIVFRTSNLERSNAGLEVGVGGYFGPASNTWINGREHDANGSVHGAFVTVGLALSKGGD